MQPVRFRAQLWANNKLTNRIDFDLIARRIVNVAVAFSVDRAFIERHNILGKSAGFVAEDILDLAEFFVQRRRPRPRRSVRRLVIHFQIPIDPPRMTETDYFHAENVTKFRLFVKMNSGRG